VADLVEFYSDDDGEKPYPIEFKRGKPKRHRADEVQLCAQALCLEEMTGRSVMEGALFYGETKRRVTVSFDESLRQLTEDTIAKLRKIFTTLETPKAAWQADRCRACSLLELCRPKVISRSARAWRERALKMALSEGDVS
jgi:CRISPR-associated exonuclease Cas4